MQGVGTWDSPPLPIFKSVYSRVCFQVSSLLTDILTNTTSQHGSHVFDQNCDVCLGKKTNKPSPVVHFVTKPLVTPDR